MAELGLKILRTCGWGNQIRKCRQLHEWIVRYYEVFRKAAEHVLEIVILACISVSFRKSHGSNGRRKCFNFPTLLEIPPVGIPPYGSVSLGTIASRACADLAFI